MHLDREPFVGQGALRAEMEHGSEWTLIGLELNWEEIEELYARHDLPPALPANAWRSAVPVYQGRRQVGQATSGVWSPVLKKNLALASVHGVPTEPGTQLRIEHTIEFARETVTATVVERPFFDPERKRA